MLYLRICANNFFYFAGPTLLASFCGQLVGWAKLSSTDELLFLGKRCFYASTVLNLSPKLTISFCGNSAQQVNSLIFGLIMIDISVAFMSLNYQKNPFFCFSGNYHDLAGTQAITTPYWNSNLLKQNTMFCSLLVDQIQMSCPLLVDQIQCSVLSLWTRFRCSVLSLWTKFNVLSSPCGPNSNVLVLSLGTNFKLFCALLVHHSLSCRLFS